MADISAEAIRGVKTDYVKRMIKETPWSMRSRINDLVRLEGYILNGVHSFAGGLHRRHLFGSYSTAHRCIVEELVGCDWLSEEQKAGIRINYQHHLERIKARKKQDIEWEKEERLADEEAFEAWVEAGGL